MAFYFGRERFFNPPLALSVHVLLSFVSRVATVTAVEAKKKYGSREVCKAVNRKLQDFSSGITRCLV
jgi:hypothetical protein